MKDTQRTAAWQLEVYKYSFKKKDKLSQIFKHLTLQGDEVVLDIGCANGILAHHLQGQVGQLHCLEPNQEYLKEAQKIIKQAKFYNGTAENLPFPDNHFDMIFMLDVLYYTDEKKTIEEMKRVLKPGGTLILTVPYLRPTLSLRFVKQKMGVDLFHEGGKREGYDQKLINRLFAAKSWEVAKTAYHSLFFIELVESVLNSMRGKKEISKQTSVAEKNISNSSSFKRYKKLYGLLTPLFVLDNILRGMGVKGHGSIFFIKKRTNE